MHIRAVLRVIAAAAPHQKQIIIVMKKIVSLEDRQIRCKSHQYDEKRLADYIRRDLYQEVLPIPAKLLKHK